MSARAVLATILVSILGTFSALAGAETPSGPDQLVLVQGAAGNSVASLVFDVGGKVTHNLPIINAVGAGVPRF